MENLPDYTGLFSSASQNERLDTICVAVCMVRSVLLYVSTVLKTEVLYYSHLYKNSYSAFLHHLHNSLLFSHDCFVLCRLLPALRTFSLVDVKQHCVAKCVNSFEHRCTQTTSEMNG